MSVEQLKRLRQALLHAKQEIKNLHDLGLVWSVEMPEDKIVYCFNYKTLRSAK